MLPKVSVIVPVYNNEKYVIPCMQSLLAQTLSDIEIICINDGSTDRSPEILHQFAEKDQRVIVVDKENGGYGVGINTGLQLARGEYVTILESDDFADLDMLETLYSYAKTFDLEVVRANFSLYWSKKIKKDHFFELFPHHECDRMINPLNPKDRHCFYVQPALWSAIYKNSFIRDNNLRLLETPGAAYQDTAFNFKIWACARRVMFVHRPFVHYRQDNESSSINNPGKVDTICLEYAEIRRWLREDRKDLHETLAPVATKMMCDAYKWNTLRVAEEYRVNFAKRFAKDFLEAERAGEVDPSLFAPGQLAEVRLTVTDPQGFVNFATKGEDPEHGIKRIVRKAVTLAQVASRYGVRDARNLLISKLLHEKRQDNPVDVMDAELATRKEPKFLSVPPTPKISVVLPVYNAEDVLSETLDSIFAQSFIEFEVICINDGSSDGSLSILESYAEKDARLRIISQSNRGVAAARNRGLDLVSAPYALILDSDDIFESEMFEKLYKKAIKEDADLTICSSCELDHSTLEHIPAPWALKLDLLPQSGHFSAEDAAENLFVAIMGWPWDRLYKTEFLQKYNVRFPENLDNSEDCVFVYSLLAKANSIALVSDVLVKHRVKRNVSVSNSREKSPECFYEAICQIKSFLKNDESQYAKYEKCFLNWALDYTLWNITSLEDDSIRQQLAQKLLNGGYPELELDSHPLSYFNQYGRSIRSRINSLKVQSRR